MRIKTRTPEQEGLTMTQPTNEKVAVRCTCTSCKLFGVCREFRAKSREHFRWTVHNLFAHPLSEIAWLLGLKRLSNWIHDVSIPMHETGKGRG